MADIEALSDAVLTLIGNDFDVHDGYVPPGSTAPWIFVLIALPEVAERSVTASPHLYRVIVRLRFVAGNATAVRQMADMVIPGIEQAIPVAANWATTAMKQLGEARLEPETDPELLETNAPLVVGYTDWDFTAQPTA